MVLQSHQHLTNGAAGLRHQLENSLYWKHYLYGAKDLYHHSYWCWRYEKANQKVLHVIYSTF
jgi:hypothetical protein